MSERKPLRIIAKRYMTELASHDEKVLLHTLRVMRRDIELQAVRDGLEVDESVPVKLSVTRDEPRAQVAIEQTWWQRLLRRPVRYYPPPPPLMLYRMEARAWPDPDADTGSRAA